MLNKGTAFLVLCFMTISTNLWANESTVSCPLDKKNCDVVFVPPLPDVSSLGRGTCEVPMAETYTIKNNRSFPVRVGPPALVPASPFVSISGSTCGLTSSVELPGGGTCTVTLTFKICAPGTVDIDIDLVIPVFTHQNELTTPIEINIPVPPALSELVIAGGEDFSNLAPPFLLVTQDEGATWDKIQVDPPQLPVGDGNLTMSSCFNSGTGSNICFAFGTNTAGYAIPLKSTDGGTTWSIFNIPEINDVNFTVNGGDCTDSGSLCIVVGETINAVNGSDKALILQSTDRGSSWSVVPITGAPAGGLFNAAACTDTVTTAQCIAVGETEPSSGPLTPLLAQTTDSGGSWGVVPITSTQGFFNAASCTESVCIAAGQYRPSTQEPLLAQSINRGAWGIVTSFSPALPSSGEFFGASCTGDNITSGLQCIAVGNSGGVPLIVQGIPDGVGGINWGTVTTALVTNGNFYASACTGSGAAAQCIAVGYDTSTGFAPLLAQSLGVGTWNVVTSFSPISLPVQGFFNTAACTGSGAAAQCIAAGQDDTTSSPAPLLAQSVNGGSNWSVVSGFSLDTVTTSSFYATSCVGSGSTEKQCIAVGQDPITFEPLLAQSIDDGTDWATVNIAGLSATGLYDKAACTDDNSLCIAPGYVGSSENNNSSPVLLKSVDQGTTWTVVSNFTTSLPALGFLNAATCTGSGADSWCVAVGSDNTGGVDAASTLIVQSIDGGASWQVISPLSGNAAILNSVSCWGTNTSGQCVAAGASAERSNNSKTLLVQSFDGSTNWSEVSNATGISGFFEATSCTGNGSNSLCIVTGGNIIAPLFASQAGGTWYAQSVSGASNGVLFIGASCIGEDISSVFCIIVGAKETASFPPSPVIAQSNGVNSWSVVSVSGSPGVYSSASCTGTGDSASYCVAVGFAGAAFSNESPLLATNKNNAGWNVISVSDIPPIISSAQFADVNCIGGSNSPFCVAVGEVDNNSPLLAQTQGGTSWYVPTIPSMPPAGILAGVGSESD